MRRFAWLIALAVLGVPPAQAQQGGGPVPVTVARVSKRDVPVLLRGIGTVQALQTVLVRARVDGTLDSVFFTEGQNVKKGDLLALIDGRPYQALLEQAQARRMASEAMLANARSDLQRYSDLQQSQAASRQRLDQVRASALQAEAAMKGDEAAIMQAALNLSFTRIVAPMDGRVGLRLLDPGNVVRVADPAGVGIVTISQIQPAAVLFTVPQDTLPQVQAALRRGKPAAIAFSSDDRTRLGDGELLTIDNAIDAATGTIRLKAVFPNSEELLWPGQFVNVRLRLDVRPGVTTIPSLAVNRGPSGLFAFVVKPDNTVAVQKLEVEQDDGQVAVIAGGLDDGAQVVIGGQSRLSNGARVAATEAKPGA